MLCASRGRHETCLASRVEIGQGLDHLYCTCRWHGDHSDVFLRACVTSVTWPLTRSSVELRPPSRQRPARVRIVETAQMRPGDLEGKSVPRPWTLWTGARGQQEPSVRSQSGWSPRTGTGVGKGLSPSLGNRGLGSLGRGIRMHRAARRERERTMLHGRPEPRHPR
jgi:hypothetical protein